MGHATTHNSIKFNYQDYRLLPEEKPCELIDGELYMTPAPIPFHQILVFRFSQILGSFVQKNDMGFVFFSPIDVVLSDEDVVQPDLLFIAKDRREMIQQEAIHGAPDLVVEILSPATAQRDMIFKRKLYSKFGVLEYWIVDPNKKIVSVLTFQESELKTHQVYLSGAILASPLLKGLQVDLAQLFEPI